MRFLILGFLLWAVLHSWSASLGFKDWVRRRVGPAWYDRFYRLAYNLFAVVSFLPILFWLAQLRDRRLYALPFPWALLFLGGQLLGIGLLVWGLWVTDPWSFLGLRQVLGQPVREDQLVLDGPYRFVRHPLYTGGLLFVWLVPLMTFNLLAFNLLLTLYLYVGARFEERKLVRQFGAAYRAYQERVPMLWPRLKV